MKSYHYYPGCSLEGTAREYDLAIRHFMKMLAIPLMEIEGWTCCGASAAEASSALLALVLPARNIAIAEQSDRATDILVPCSACYLNLKKTEIKLLSEPFIAKQVNEALSFESLFVQGRVRIRHFLEILVQDIDLSAIKRLIKHPLTSLVVAPYYGCQALRPYPVFDDPERPCSMDALIRLTGASVLQWETGAPCCGASLATTKPTLGLKHIRDILEHARGADAIVTICPMCQMNLGAYQKKLSKETQTDLNIPVLYLPQRLDIAMGMPLKASGMHLNLSATTDFFSTLGF